MIVIPMAGISRRFAEAGYKKPKYMLEAGNVSLFRHSIDSFASYFKTHPFLFIYRNFDNTGDFIRNECREAGVSNANFVELSEPTGGQAETVQLGLTQLNVSKDTPVTIFNIDTIRPNFVFPNDPTIMQSDGYLEVFVGEGLNWSFVKSEEHTNRALATTEKNPVSNLCCTGLYHFAKAGFFLESYARERLNGPSQAGEYYVAPLYNHLIAQGLDIRYHVIPHLDVIFSGIPKEYEEFRSTFC